MTTTKQNEKYLLQSANNTLKVIESIGKLGKATLKDVCVDLGMQKSSVFRILYTLEYTNFIYRDQAMRYHLSEKMIALGMSAMKHRDGHQRIADELNRLRDSVNETTNYGMLVHGPAVMIVNKAESKRVVKTTLDIGEVLPIHASAMGKSILAFHKNPSLLDEIKANALNAYTNNTITEYKSLIDRLNTIRNIGYSSDEEEVDLGLTCFAYPVFGSDGEVRSAVSISGATPRILENKEHILQMLKKTSKIISQILESEAMSGLS
ncbi:IclR family transcriptional regulator [Peptoniphilaceae bacterium SGI.137]|nr:IclR family transcriptional regulator [Peptoniphilaceae bacterium]